MRILKTTIKWIAAILALGYISIATYLYFNQENILFHPKKLDTHFEYAYDTNFEELFFEVEEDIKLNALLFKADSAKGLVFYLHGNGGSLATWGREAPPFVANGYNCLILDYRGYGKSDGEITSESEWLNDLQFVYNKILKEYDESKIIIVGYSVGSGPAAYLASQNKPSQLILKAPYNNIEYMLKLHYPWLPALALRYHLTTDRFLKDVKAKVTIIHGENDKLIPVDCSIKLKETFKPQDRLVIIKGQNHHRFTENEEYLTMIDKLLSQ